MSALRFYSGTNYAAWVYPGHVHTVLSDGSSTRGVPLLDDVGFRRSAIDLGYGDDPLWHMLEHDILHSWVAEKVKGKPSVSLWAQAHDDDAWLKPGTPESEAEEKLVAAMQSALNGNQWGLDRLYDLVGYCDAQALVFEASEMLRPDGEAMTAEWAACGVD